MLSGFGFPTEDNLRRENKAVQDPEATLMITVTTRVMRMTKISPSSPPLLLWTEAEAPTSRDPQSSSGMSPPPRRTLTLSQQLWSKQLELDIVMIDTLIF